MKILIKNCNLISMNLKEPENKIQRNMDILIENKKIIKISKNIKDSAEKVIDGTEKIVMPGLINTHAHVPMSIFRETVDGYITQDWLTQKIWPIEAKLTEEDIYFASMLSYIEMIYSGTTTINDMYFMQNKIVDAALDTGVRLQVTRTLMDTDGSGEKKLIEIEEFIKKYKEKYDTISLNVGIHGLYTNTEEYLQKGLEIAKKYKLPVNMHFCENEQEREDIKKMYNVASPIEPIDKYFKNVHLILAHAVKLTNEEIERIAKQDIYIAHCPVSNLKLGCGIAPITKMQEENICISLGTDGQGSGSNLDMFETMKFTALLQKGINENPEDLPAYEVLKMATINGAKALNLNETGKIEEGKLADLIIINMEETITNPINNIFAEIVYNVKGSNVDTTIINGKVLMENRKISNVNKKEIIQKCEEIINRIKK
mgnify:CR=1 FL=1